MRKIIYLQVLPVLIFIHTSAQKRSDTAAIIKEFNEVMTFSVQPYLHYSSVISLRSGPMTDTAVSGSILHNEFYKVQDDLYYGNEQEEVFLQDSLMVRISHSRKTVLLTKVDMATKKRMDVLPLKRTDMQRMLREHCTLSRLPDEGDTGRIMISTHEKRMSQGFTYSDMLVVYHRGSHLPVRMEMNMHLRNEENEQMTEALKANGFDVAKMTSVKDGRKSLDMTRTASINFGEIEIVKEKAEQMPLWRDRVDYDGDTKTYNGKGRCEGYEVTKTF
ncbi:MAG: hypothetical protein J0H74_28255 [Chitinophagaceae bacterium]|nr:hypothetical protein [Chitinophagaceae bacterium]